MIERQLPQQGNIQLRPLEGVRTGELKPVRLNHLYKGGKQCDMPMYNKSTDVDPGSKSSNKITVVQTFVRSR